ncbi:MAG: hypothetical protein ACXVCX_18730 [Ktedonobacterales bacterium]
MDGAEPRLLLPSKGKDRGARGAGFGLTFWTVTFTILIAQLIGMLLQTRGQYLATQIPISAALALVTSSGTR